MTGRSRSQTQASTVIDNLRGQLRGQTPMANYAPTKDARILLPLGTTGGVGQMPTPMPNGPLTVASLGAVIERKGRDLFTARFAERFSRD